MQLEVVDDPSAVAFSDQVALYRDHEWWDDRDLVSVQRAIENSDVFVGLQADGDLVASARVLTDGVFYARIYDVIVAADRRGDGLGKRLMEETIDHPKLAGVETIHLDCQSDLAPFYERVGFEPRDLEQEYETMVIRQE